MPVPSNITIVENTVDWWYANDPVLTADPLKLAAVVFTTNDASTYVRYKPYTGLTWRKTPYLQMSFDKAVIGAIDSVPTDGSNNAVSSNGVYDALFGKQAKTESLTQEDVIDDADSFPFYDNSSVGNKKTLWSNIKAKLKMHFDSIYAAASHVHSYLPLSGGTMTGLIQFGTTTARNVYAKFISNNNGNYFGLHSDYDTFWLHKQNSAGTVLANPFYYDSSGNMGLTAAGLLTLTPYSSSYNAAANLVGSYMCFEGNNETYCQLGRSSMRWKALYAVSGTIQTSDKRRKTDASYDLEKIKQVLSVVKPLSFRYNDIENDKIRFGVYAQDFEKELVNAGFDPADIAALTVDEIEPDDVITDGKIYGIGYDQFIPVAIGMIQDLQDEIKNLKETLIAIESKVL